MRVTNEKIKRLEKEVKRFYPKRTMWPFGIIVKQKADLFYYNDEVYKTVDQIKAREHITEDELVIIIKEF